MTANKRFALAVISLAVSAFAVGFAIASSADAKAFHRHHLPARHHKQQRKHRKPRRRVAPKPRLAPAKPTQPAAPLAPLPSLIGIGNAPGCTNGADPTAPLEAYHASILRIIVNPYHGANGEALPCVQTAIAEGVKVHIDIQWLNSQSLDEVAAYFRQVVAIYGPYAWAISIGNEQELWTGGPQLSGAQYAQVWQAVEPIVAQLAPNAIRVAGETAPWSLAFLRAAVQAGLPGAQALAAHPYAMSGSYLPSQWLAYGASVGLPVWFTEGLAGPCAWPGTAADQPLAALRGAQVADAWVVWS